MQTGTGKSGRDWANSLTVIGKGKKGSVRVNADTKICKVTTAGNSGNEDEPTVGKKSKNEHLIRVGVEVGWVHARLVCSRHVQGKLIEVNERLLQQPDLLTCSPLDKGYIAVIMITNLQKLIKQQNGSDDVRNDE